MSRARIVFLLVPALFIGCAQNTESIAPQASDQQQVTPTVTAQDQMTAGSDVRVFIINAPGNGTLPPNPTGDDEVDGMLASTDGLAATTGKVNSGYAQAGINVNITTGGTTPTATGSATGTSTASQTPSQNQTVAPVQDIKPEVTAAAPITVGLPGSATSGSANVAGSGGQMGDPTTSPTQTPTWTQLKVPAQYAADAIAFLRDFLRIKSEGGTPVLTSQPE
jgi:hypothetical protein